MRLTLIALALGFASAAFASPVTIHIVTTAYGSHSDGSECFSPPYRDTTTHGPSDGGSLAATCNDVTGIANLYDEYRYENGALFIVIAGSTDSVYLAQHTGAVVYMDVATNGVILGGTGPGLADFDVLNHADLAFFSFLGCTSLPCNNVPFTFNEPFALRVAGFNEFAFEAPYTTSQFGPILISNVRDLSGAPVAAAILFDAPEPSTAMLFLTGLSGVAVPILRRRSRRA